MDASAHGARGTHSLPCGYGPRPMGSRAGLALNPDVGAGPRASPLPYMSRRAMRLPILALLLPSVLVWSADAQDLAPLPMRVTGPPPAWIEPGLRLTYSTLVGTLPDAELVYEADAGGLWVDDHGNHYRQVEVAAQGSHGFLQADVVALTAAEAAVQLRFYLLEGVERDAPLLSVETGYVAPASTGGDLWIHPDRLRELAERGVDGVLVKPLQHTLELATYDALLFYAPRPSGKSVWIYDLASGVLLYSSDVTRMHGQRNAAGIETGAGGLQVRFTTFQASRTLGLPWASRAAPAPPASLERLAYRGRFVVRQSGAADTVVPFEAQFRAERRSDGFLLLTPAAQGGVSLPGLERRLVGAHQLGGPWIPPSGLATLRPMQELDRDPLTRVTTFVGAVDEREVVLTQDSPRQRGEFTYRRSDGVLRRLVTEERFTSVPGMSKVVELELVEGG